MELTVSIQTENEEPKCPDTKRTAPIAKNPKDVIYESQTANALHIRFIREESHSTPIILVVLFLICAILAIVLGFVGRFKLRTGSGLHPAEIASIHFGVVAACFAFILPFYQEIPALTIRYYDKTIVVRRFTLRSGSTMIVIPFSSLLSVATIHKTKSSGSGSNRTTTGNGYAVSLTYRNEEGNTRALEFYHLTEYSSHGTVKQVSDVISECIKSVSTYNRVFLLVIFHIFDQLLA